MNKVYYKGYIVSQFRDNYLIITKNGKNVFHASFAEKLTRDDLKDIV